MKFLSRFINTNADEDEDGWLSDVEGEDASIDKATSIGKAASVSRFMMKLLKRHQSVDEDDSGLTADLEMFSQGIAAGLGSDVDAVSLLATQVSGPSETVSGGPAVDQAVAPPLFSSPSPTPDYIVDDPEEESADATARDKKESAMPEKNATDAPDRESAPPPAGDTAETTAPEQAATAETTAPEPAATLVDENNPGSGDLSLSDIFAEEVPENDGLRVLTESLDEVDVAELAVELHSLVEDLRNR